MTGRGRVVALENPVALHPARDIVGKLAEKVLREVVLREVRKAPAWGRRGLVCQDIQDVGSKFEQVTPHAYSFSDSKFRSCQQQQAHGALARAPTSGRRHHMRRLLLLPPLLPPSPLSCKPLPPALSLQSKSGHNHHLTIRLPATDAMALQRELHIAAVRRMKIHRRC
jgi:hypothetical protein